MKELIWFGVSMVGVCLTLGICAFIAFVFYKLIKKWNDKWT